MSLLTNQFRPTTVAGTLDLQTNPNPFVFTVRYNPQDTSTNTLVPGEGIVLTDLGANDAAGLPIVAKRTADTQAIYGVKIFSTKQASTPVGDACDVAGAGAVVWMTASGAITRNARVGLVLASAGTVIAQQASQSEFGISLDHVSSGQLCRIQITAANVATT